MAIGALNQDPLPETSQNLFEFSDLTAADYATGTRQYLVYRINTDTGKAEDLSLWNRKTEIILKDGSQFIEVTQDWKSVNENRIRKLRSVNRLKDFSPITHYVEDVADSSISAYSFLQTRIDGAANVANNSRNGFSMESLPQTLNWELDMETFPMLPLAAGKSFDIHFYHPGSRQEPQAYTYTVIGEETLHDMAGHPIESWLLSITYGEQGKGTFWIAKDNKRVIKTEEKFGNFVRYKVLLGVPTGL